MNKITSTKGYKNTAAWPPCKSTISLCCIENVQHQMHSSYQTCKHQELTFYHKDTKESYASLTCTKEEVDLQLQTPTNNKISTTFKHWMTLSTPFDPPILVNHHPIQGFDHLNHPKNLQGLFQSLIALPSN